MKRTHHFNFLPIKNRLQTGWSSYQQDVFSVAKKHSLNEEEQCVLKMVLEKKEKIQLQEQARIGYVISYIFTWFYKSLNCYEVN